MSPEGRFNLSTSQRIVFMSHNESIQRLFFVSFFNCQELPT